MNVNGINEVTYSQTTQSTDTQKTVADKTVSQKEETAAVYEGSKDTQKTTYYTKDTAVIDKLKADADARNAQLRSLVEKIMLGQGNAIGTADDMWSFLRTGNFTVDAETKAQAQADIAEDGYWGVEQTSDRMIDFAKALSGGDPDKIEEMREAFQKGFKMAEEKWGGELPEISQKTYDATMEKFDAWAAEYAESAETIV